MHAGVFVWNCRYCCSPNKRGRAKPPAGHQPTIIHSFINFDRRDKKKQRHKGKSQQAPGCLITVAVWELVLLKYPYSANFFAKSVLFQSHYGYQPSAAKQAHLSSSLFSEIMIERNRNRGCKARPAVGTIDQSSH